MAIGFEDRHLKLIEIVADVFSARDDWPKHAYVDAVLDHAHGLSFADAMVDMPAGAVRTPSTWHAGATVQLDVSALRAIDACTKDLDHYLALIRYAVERERRYVPDPLGDLDLRISAAEVESDVLGADAGRRERDRLLKLVDGDIWASFAGSRDGDWFLNFDTRVRHFRSATTIDEYVEMRDAALRRVGRPTLLPSNPTVFIVMPFGPAWATNVHDMIEQACAEAAADVPGLSWVRADQMSEPGRITDQIVAAIQTADLIVADSTGNNPNVMFELGFADASGKKIVLLNQELGHTPFDIKDWRQIVYSTDDLGLARTQLVSFIRAGLRRVH